MLSAGWCCCPLSELQPPEITHSDGTAEQVHYRTSSEQIVLNNIRVFFILCVLRSLFFTLGSIKKIVTIISVKVGHLLITDQLPRVPDNCMKSSE